jgi:hypothetical protein
MKMNGISYADLKNILICYNLRLFIFEKKYVYSKPSPRQVYSLPD